MSSSRSAYLFVTINLILLLVFLIGGASNLSRVQSTVFAYDELLHQWFALRIALTDPRTPLDRDIRALPEYRHFDNLVAETRSSVAILAAGQLSPELNQAVSEVVSTWQDVKSQWGTQVGAAIRDTDDNPMAASFRSMDLLQSTLLKSRDALGRFVATQERALSVLLFCLGATIVLVIVVSTLVEAENERNRRAALRTRLLARNTLATQERERARIAHSLHDSLAQELSLAKLESEIIRRSVSPAGDEGARTVERLNLRLSASIDWVRNLAYELRPAEIDAVGLAFAVRSYCQEVAAGQDVSFDWTVGDEIGQIPTEHAMNVYRIVQEAITNAVRHSRASRIMLNLQTVDRSIELVVSDNGTGMGRDPTRRDEVRNGLGIAGMEERAQMLNATLTIDSRQGQGTTVRLLVPIDAPHRKDQ